jgi:hypothetical protein
MRAGGALAVALGAASAIACGTTVEVQPAGRAYAPTIATIVEMPPAIDWTGAGA